MTVHVCTHDWPVGNPPVDPQALVRVLAQFDRWYPVAVKQLAEQGIPAADAEDES